MLIQSARFNTFFPKISNIRRKAFEIEDKLKPNYLEVQTNPIPDDMPEIIPRIHTNSVNGHSQIEISLTNAQVVVNYDDNYNKNWEKCFEYITNQAAILSNAMYPILNDGNLFSGLTIELAIKDVDAIDIIKRKFLNYQSNLEPHDIEYKLTYIINENKYVNLTFKNTRVYEGFIHSDMQLLNFTELKNGSNFLSIAIDINDRLAFNKNPIYRSDANSQKEIFDIARGLLDNKLDFMLEKGVIEI